MGIIPASASSGYVRYLHKQAKRLRVDVHLLRAIWRQRRDKLAEMVVADLHDGPHALVYTSKGGRCIPIAQRTTRRPR